MDRSNQHTRSIQARPMINVTPLIDVLLVLLIIFMTIAPLAPRLYAAKLPERPPQDERTAVDEPLALMITVQADGTYLLNSTSFATLSGLQVRLKEALDGRPPELCTVFIRAPRALRYGEMIKVIDAAKTAGSHPIGMVIDQLDQ